MSYDTALAVFSPDGRLIQVERAQLASEQGALVVFSRHESFISIAFEKRTSNKLLLEDDNSKLLLIDQAKNIYLTFSGFSPDSLVIVNQARLLCRSHKYSYGVDITLDQLARKLAEFKKVNTVEGSRRPYGIRTILMCYEDDFLIYVVEPDGNYSTFDRGAIGNRNDVVIKHFEETKVTDDDVIEGIFMIVQSDASKVSSFKILKSGIERVSREHIQKTIHELMLKDDATRNKQ